jgi:hypothetical protein
LISSKHAPGLSGSPIGQAVSLASPFFHWIWSGVRAMAWVGSMLAWAKAGAAEAMSMDARSRCLIMNASPVVLAPA